MAQLSNGHVFMSYSRRDENVMRRIAAFLRKKGINVWLDNEKLIPGTPIWEEEIEKAIKGALAIVVVLSPDSKESEWVRREISMADQNRKRIFPVLVRGDEDTSITLRLITRQYVDLRENEGLGLTSLHSALSEYLDELNVQLKERGEEKKPATRKAETEKYAKESSKLEIDKTTVPDTSSQTLLWFTLGWAIAGAMGGFTYNIFDEVPGEIVGGAIGGIMGGMVVVTALRLAGKVSHQKNLMWMVLAWAFGGSIGWLIGWELTEAIGAGIGMAIFVIVGLAGTFGMDYVRSNWKSITLIALAWAIGGAIGWSISKGMIENLDIDLATSWVIGTAIGWAIGGYVLGRHLLKDKSESEEIANSSQPSRIKLTETQKAFLLSWQGRTLSGVIVGIVLGLIYGISYGLTNNITYDFAYAYSTFYLDTPNILLLVACGFAGLLAYPHKGSVALLIIGFFVAGAGVWQDFAPYEFIATGGILGLPAGALISRILYWLKVIK